MKPARLHRQPRRLLALLRDDTSGLALIEFAFALPIVLAMGSYGIEISNQAIVNLKISQIALDLADNASRVGVDSNDGLSTMQLREADLNDILAATAREGKGIKLTTYGRITLSSLENVPQKYDKTQVQRIHWQRCLGANSKAGYGSTDTGPAATTAGDAPSSSTYVATKPDDAYAGLVSTTGMGDSVKVTAPSGSGVMFAEINYDYQPLFGGLFVKSMKIHYIASFIVRDKRDFTQIYKGSVTQTKSTCNLYNANVPGAIVS